MLNYNQFEILLIESPRMNEKSISYQEAGVDIENANTLIKNIQEIATSTRRPGVLSNIGGFAALFELSAKRLQQPVLVSSTDGVGTKLKLATQLNQHEGVGIDLVAMCVNDVICNGAEPLFFLDYFASGKLNNQQALTIIKSISQGCQQASVALVGGETAEMPGMYHNDEYDLAGFCVGVVEKDRIIDGSKVQVGDQLIAIASSGVHSNGFSLVRKIIEKNRIDLNQDFNGFNLGKTLLTPTRIYVKTIQALLKMVDIHSIAHITGGGIVENLPRVLPKYAKARIKLNSWRLPLLFQWIQEQGNISDEEMYRTFNLGVGMIIAVSQSEVNTTIDIIQAAGERSWVIGDVVANPEHESKVTIIP